MKPTVILAAVLAALPRVYAVWPQPTEMTTGHTVLPVDASALKIHLPDNAPHDLRAAAKRIAREIKASKMMALVPDRGASREKQMSHAKLSAVQVTLGGADAAHQLGTRAKISQGQVAISGHKKQGGAPQSIADAIHSNVKTYDESYHLEVPSDGSAAKLHANSSLGALRGLTTLQHLLYALPSQRGGSERYIADTPISIKDAPAFGYRGLLLDTARAFFSVEALKRTIDTMAFVKMNQLHWHMTDAQSWPLALEGDLAVLAEKGAYSAAETYDKKAVAEVVSYAAARGVNVNVEIDMPGHQYAGVQDMPGDLIACGAHDPWSAVANEPPSGQLDMRKPAAAQFAVDVIGQTAPLFPSAYFGTGGDEVNLKCYGASNASDIDASLLKPFLQKAHGAVAKAGKVPMVWEEMALNFPETGRSLLNGTLVEAWTSVDNVKKILESNPGVDIIHAPYTNFYLDCGRGEPLTGARNPSWCPFVTAWDMYSFDPLNGTQGIENGAARVLGGEAAMWTESVGEGNLDTIVWPRAAAAAEVFWTGASFTQNGNTTARKALEAAPRLNDAQYRMVDRGVAAQPLVVHWCALRPEKCTLV